MVLALQARIFARFFCDFNLPGGRNRENLRNPQSHSCPGGGAFYHGVWASAGLPAAPGAAAALPWALHTTPGLPVGASPHIGLEFGNPTGLNRVGMLRSYHNREPEMRMRVNFPEPLGAIGRPRGGIFDRE